MNRASFILLLLTPMVLTSCATRALWDHTDPHELLVLERTPEEEARLRAKGLLYRVDVERNALYVQKGRLRKTHDYLIRFFATPITVTHDAAVAAAVVGAAAYLHSEGGGTRSEESIEEAAKLDRLQRLMRDLEDEARPRK